MGGNFHEKLEEVLRIKFHSFKFHGTILYFCVRKRNVNFELGTHDANFGFDKERIARLSPEKVWLRETRGKMERFSLESCVGGYHVYKGQTPLVLAYLNENYWPRSWLCFCLVLLLSSLSPSPHAGRKGTLQIEALSTGHK